MILFSFQLYVHWIDLKSILLFATPSSDSNRSVVTILESQSKPNEEVIRFLEISDGYKTVHTFV